MFNFKAVGLRIKDLRKEQGLTQEALAEKVDVSTEHINRIESGLFRPSLYLIENLAKVFNTSEQHILFGTNKTNNPKDDLIKEKISMLSDNKKTAVLNIIDLISE